MRVKICGITRVEDAYEVAQSGADAIGLVFYPPSSRYIADLSLAREIADAVGPFVTVTGLFVNASSDEIRRTLDEVPLQLLQFHGDETEQQCSLYKRPYIKALRMRDGIDISATMDEYASAQGFLLDTYVKGAPGGTGQSFDWQRVPQNSPRPIVLAGGLTAENVALAVESAKPYAVDVSGGVESSPGIKDRDKIRAFVAQANIGV